MPRQKLFLCNLFFLLGLGLFSTVCLASQDTTNTVLAATQGQFDKPKEIKIFDLGRSPYTDSKNIKLSCYVYPLFSILELDEGEMGAKLSVHYRTDDAKNDLCQQNFNGKKSLLPDTQGYLQGVVGNYIFISFADTFGGIGKFNIFNVYSGTKVFDPSYNANKPLVINHIKDKISLTYYRPLSVSCVPTANEANCWKEILKNNNVDEKVKISMPDCREAIKRNPNAFKDPERNIQVTVKVYVDNLANPKVVYLDGDATCAASP